MGDVPDTYARPHDPSRPMVCADEGGKQLIGDIREPLSVRPGSPATENSEYVRGGVANLFMAFDPLAGWRHVEVTERKSGSDFGRILRVLSDEHYAEAERVVLVCENLSNHTPAALYEAFEPAEARRLAVRFEWHYTPRHGSWLNVAEVELSMLARQCLDRRLPDLATLWREVSTREVRRYAAVVKMEWQFTTADARRTLKRLRPTTQLQ